MVMSIIDLIAMNNEFINYNMKYCIGDIVKYDSTNAWIVISTKQDPLTIRYLDELTNIIKVKDIREMALHEIIVEPGFDYVIKRFCVMKESMLFWIFKMKIALRKIYGAD
jgi:hypothetical protein